MTESEKKWYLVTVEGRQGPYSDKEIFALAQSTEAPKNAQIWKEGMASPVSLDAVLAATLKKQQQQAHSSASPTGPSSSAALTGFHQAVPKKKLNWGLILFILGLMGLTAADHFGAFQPIRRTMAPFMLSFMAKLRLR